MHAFLKTYQDLQTILHRFNHRQGSYNKILIRFSIALSMLIILTALFFISRCILIQNIGQNSDQHGNYDFRLLFVLLKILLLLHYFLQAVLNPYCSTQSEWIEVIEQTIVEIYWSVLYCDQQVYNNWSISIDSSVSYLQIFADQLDMERSTHNDQGFRQLISQSIIVY